MLGGVAQTQETPLRYRVIEAPSDLIRKLARGEYRPMRREEFSRLADLLKRNLPGAVFQGATLDSGSLTARLEDRELLTGSCSWHVTNDDNESTWISLGKPNLALSDVRWLPEGGQPTTAKLGAFRDGEMMLHVPSSGTLQAQWTLAPVETQESRWRYLIKLPAAPVSRLDLRLPADLELSVDVGVARKIELQQDPAAAAAQAGEATRIDVWQVDLGGHHRCQLTVKRRDAPDPTVALRQSNRYQITEQGFELASELNLACDQTPLERLQLSVDPSLRITQIQQDGRELAWSSSVEGEATTAARDNRIDILFSPPLVGLNQVVRIKAVAPPVLDASIELPRIRCVGVDWRQEATRLRLSDQLVARDLKLVRSHQVPEPEDAAVGSVRGNRSIAIQHVANGHGIRLRLGREPDRVEFRSGSRIRLNDDGLAAEVDVDFRFLTGEQFTLHGLMSPDWVIESVESDTATLIDKWREDPQNAASLEIRLATPPTLNTWQRFTVKARRRPFEAGPNPIPLQALLPVVFRGSKKPERHFFYVGNAAAFKIDYLDDGRFDWLTNADLDSDELTLLGADAEPLVIHCRDDSLQHQIVLDRPLTAAPPIRATLDLTTEFGHRQTTERIRVNVQRTGAAMRPFHIRLSQKREVGMRWFVDVSDTATTDDGSGRGLEARSQRELATERISDPSRPTDEIWKIEWPEYVDREFVIVGERSWDTHEAEVISLGRIDEATEQGGTVAVVSAADLALAFDVVPDFLSPLILEHPPFRRISQRQRAFRYSPDDDIFNRDKRLSVSIKSTDAFEAELTPWLTVWKLQLTTFLDEAGASRNTADLFIENRGAAAVKLRLPSQANLSRILTGQEAAAYETVDGEVRITLPLDERFVRLSVEYDLAESALGVYQTVKPFSPEIIEAPVVQRFWKLWTPPEYLLANAGWEEPTQLPVCGPLSLQDPEGTIGRWPAAFRAEPSDSRGSETMRRTLAAIGTPTQLNLGRDIGRLAGAVWVDAEELARHGITPRSVVDDAANRSMAVPESLARLQSDAVVVADSAEGELAQADVGQTRVARRRLRLLGLALVELDNGVLLTTESRLAKLMPVAASASMPGGVRLRGYRLQGGQVLPNTTCLSGVRFVSANQWRTLPAAWSDARSSISPYVAAGWNLYELEMSGATVRLYRYTSFQVFSAAVFIFGVALSQFLGRFGWRKSWLATSALVLASLLLGAPFQLLAWRAAWGTVLGFVLLVLSGLAKPRSQRADPTELLLSAKGGAWLTTCLIVWIALRDVSAIAQGIARPVADEPRVFEVYSPIDASRTPVGDFLYIPDALRRVLQDANPRRPDWVLVSSNYRGVLEQTGDGNQLELKTIAADFDLEITSLSSAIQFPIPAESIGALGEEAYLDGRRIRLEWNPQRTSLVLPIRQAGRHHLQLSFETLTISDEGRARVMLQIPTTADATLVLTSPEELQPLEVPSALGAITRREATGELFASLGASDRLDISWPIATVTDPSPAIEQLVWLRLGRDEVRLDLQLVIDTTRYREATVVVEVDERLQFDVNASDQPLSLAFVPERGSRRMEFRINEVDEERALIKLGFIDTFASGLGFVSLPYFAVVGERVETSVGVSADPELVLRVTPGNGQPLKPTVFNESWGGSRLPDLAYRFPDEVRDWICQGQQSAAPTQVDWQIAYQLASSSTRLAAIASVWNESGTTFQQELRLPRSMRVEAIRLLTRGAGTTEEDLRWARNENDEVTVFFDRAVPGSFRMGIAAVRDDTLGRRDLPKLSLADSVTESVSVDLFREHDVVVDDLAFDADDAPEVPAFIRERVGAAIWQARWSTPDVEAPWLANVQENQREFRAVLVNEISRDETGWEHDFQVYLTVEAGTVDSLTFEIPEEWRDEWQSDEFKLSYRRSPLPGFVRATVLPKLRTFERDSVLRFRGTIPNVREGRLSVPNVRLLNRGNVERLLFLPTNVDSQPVPWRTGVGVEPLGEDRPAIAFAEQPNARGLRIVADEFDVERMPARSRVGAPQVTLADVQIVMGQDDESPAHGLAVFDLQPDGINACRVVLPASLQLLNISVDGQSLGVGQLEDAAASAAVSTIDLLSSQLPQSVAVLFTTTPDVAASASSLGFDLPQLAMASPESTTIDVRRTLVTLHRRGRRLNRLVASASTTELARWRLMNQLDVMEAAAGMSSDFAVADIQRWFQTWGERLVVAKRDWDLLATTDSAANIVERRYAELVSKWQANALQPLGAGESACTARAVVEDSMVLRNDVAQMVVDEPLTHVRFKTRRNTYAWSRVGLAWFAVLLGAALQLVNLRDDKLQPNYLSQGACLLGVAGGVAWWFYLAPAFFGVCIALLSLFVWALLRWRSTD